MRALTKAEKQEIVDLTAKEFGMLPDKDTIWGWLENGKSVAFDHYMTDSPGYAGKVISVIWPGSPSMFDVYTVDVDGKLRKEEKENGN